MAQEALASLQAEEVDDAHFRVLLQRSAAALEGLTRELSTLRDEIESARDQLDRTRASLEAKTSAADRAAAEYAQAVAEVEEYEAVLRVLETVDAAERKGVEVDVECAKESWLAAAAACAAMVDHARSLSAAKLHDDPEVLMELKIRVHQRHALLVSSLNAQVDSSLRLRPKVVEFHERPAFGGAWDALATLGLRDKHLETVARNLRTSILQPLFAAAANQALNPRANSPLNGHHVWTWGDEKSEGTPLALAVTAVESASQLTAQR